jgi:hypothetical protein
VLYEAADDDGKLNAKLAKARLAAANREKAEIDEIEALTHVIGLFKAEADAKATAKAAKDKLDRMTFEQYGKLADEDVQRLVIQNKWGGTLALGIDAEVAVLGRKLVDRLNVLASRYEQTLGALNDNMETLSAKVSGHLAAMGVLGPESDQSMMHGLLTGRTRLPGFTEPWQLVRLGDHVRYVKNVALSRAQLDKTSPIRYLHYGDIHTRASAALDAAAEEMPRAPRSLIRTAELLAVGDVVFADASEDPAGVGKSVEITGVPREGAIPGLHTITARFDKRILADGFKAYLQYIPAFREQLLALAAGTKVLATTRGYISSIELMLPGVAEQTAIASVLEDIEAEIEALERRLEAARAIKRGMMQELLTGRTRLGTEGDAP